VQIFTIRPAIDDSNGYTAYVAEKKHEDDKSHWKLDGSGSSEIGAMVWLLGLMVEMPLPKKKSPRTKKS
jgi:hypothetical protein